MDPKRPTTFAKAQTSVAPDWEPTEENTEQTPIDEASLPVLPLFPRLIFSLLSLAFIVIGVVLLCHERPERTMPRMSVEVVALAPDQQSTLEAPVLLTAYGEKVIWEPSIGSLARRLEAGLPFTIEAHRVSAGTYQVFDTQGIEFFILFSFFFLLLSVCVVVWKYGHQEGNALNPLYPLPPPLQQRVCNRILLIQGLLIVLGWGTWSLFLGWTPWLLIGLVPFVAMLLARLGYARIFFFVVMGIFPTVGLAGIILSLTVWYAPTTARTAECVVVEPLFHHVVTHSKKHGTWQERVFLVRYECQGQTHFGIFGAPPGSALSRKLQAPGARVELTYDPKSPFPEQLYAGSFPEDRVRRFWIVLFMSVCFCVFPPLFAFLNKRRSKPRKERHTCKKR